MRSTLHDDLVGFGKGSSTRLADNDLMKRLVRTRIRTCAIRFPSTGCDSSTKSFGACATLCIKFALRHF